MVHSWYGAATGIGLVAALFLSACAEMPASEEVRESASLTGGAAAPSKPASEADNLLKLADDVDARGSPATALPLYERAAALPTADAATFVKLGDVYAKVDRLDDATNAYRVALTKQAEFGPALLGLGGVLVRTGKAEEGMALLAKAAPLVRSARAYDRLGVAHIALGQPREALASFEQAHLLDTDDIDISSNLTLAAALSGHKDKVAAMAKATLASREVEDYQRRNIILAMCIAGQEQEAKKAGGPGIDAAAMESLIQKARDIRQISSAKGRALALAGARTASAATVTAATN
jgi:tetratricopeptide (TPR) repeat protein